MYFLEGYNCVFQQDRAAIQISKSIKVLFHQNNSKVMDWLALKQSLWRKLARTMYEYGPQYFSTKELKIEIEQEWYEMRWNPLCHHHERHKNCYFCQCSCGNS